MGAEAPNTEHRSVVVYGVDQRGLGMFQNLTGSITRGLRGRPVVAAPSFTGWMAPPQQFKGAAALGRVRPVVGKSSEIGDQLSTSLPDPVMAAFLKRDQS